MNIDYTQSQIHNPNINSLQDLLEYQNNFAILGIKDTNDGESITIGKKVLQDLAEIIEKSKVQGVQGIRGEPGDDGDMGRPGPQGIQGPAGSIQGIQGIQGIAGPGKPGDPGSQGIQGIKGTSIIIIGELKSIEYLPDFNTYPRPNIGNCYLIEGWLWEYTGTQFSDRTHFRGFERVGYLGGSQGIQGIQGLVGKTGRGVQGIQGIAGMGGLGIQGLQGIQGHNGQKGGSIRLIGSLGSIWELPDNEGTLGDCYLIEGWLWEFTQEQFDEYYINGYQRVGYIMGPQGEPGEPGPAGPQGPIGAAIKIKGSLSSSRELEEYEDYAEVGDGYIINGDLWVFTGTPIQNATHDWGFENVGHIQGPQGIQGIQGKSVQGIQGLSGRSVQGFQGLQGSQGPPGDSQEAIQGYQGLRGYRGYPGEDGDNGLQGIQGLIGLQGFKGEINLTSRSYKVNDYFLDSIYGIPTNIVVNVFGKTNFIAEQDGFYLLNAWFYFNLDEGDAENRNTILISLIARQNNHDITISNRLANVGEQISFTESVIATNTSPNEVGPIEYIFYVYSTIDIRTEYQVIVNGSNYNNLTGAELIYLSDWTHN